MLDESFEDWAILFEPTDEQVASLQERNIKHHVIPHSEPIKIGHILEYCADHDTYFEGVVVSHPGQCLLLGKDFVLGAFYDNNLIIEDLR